MGFGEHTELVDALVDGRILLVVLLQGQHVDNLGQQLGDNRRLGVPHHHAREAPGDIVLHARVRDGQRGVELRHNLLVQAQHVGVARADDELADGEGRVGLGQEVRVREAVEHNLGQGLREGRHRRVEVPDDLGEGASGGRPLLVLLRAGVPDDGLLEDLEVLRETGTHRRRHADHDVHGRVDDEPVELGRAVLGVVVLLVTEVLLAGVAAGDDRRQSGDHLRLKVLDAKDGGTASLERLGRVLVDGRDDTPIRTLVK